MGFAERNTMAGKTSSVSFPDAIKRQSSNTATQFTIQIHDQSGAPNDPDSGKLYVRVTNAIGTGQADLLYSDSGMSSLLSASSNATFATGVLWKEISTSNGAATIYHKTGTGSSLEGIYHLEYGWFENSEAISSSKMFRIIDLADLDDLNTNVGSDSDSASSSGSVHGKIKQVAADIAGLNDPTAAANADAIWDEALSGHTGSGSAGKSIADILVDTAAMQPIVAALPDSGALTSLATATALATVDTNVDDIEAAVGALGDAASADYGTSRTAMAMLRKIGADVAVVDGVADAVLVDTGTTIPATLGSPAGASMSADIAALKVVADGVQTDLDNGTDGLGALKTLIDTVDTNVDDVEAAVGALGAAASADYGTTRTAMAMLRKLGADVATADAVVDGIQTDLSNSTDGLGALKTLIDAVDVVADAILVDTGTTLPATLGSPAGASMSADVAALKVVADGIQTDLDNGTDGLGALKTLVDTVDTVVDGIQTDLSNGTDGLGALKTLIDTVDTVADAVLVDTGTTLPATLGSPAGASMSADIADIKVDTAAAVADLANGTDGLGALKTLIDNVQTAVNAVQNNTRFVAAIPGKINRPSSGSEAVAVACYLYDEAGNMEDPDSNGLFVKISQMDGTAVTGRYFSDSGLSSAISASGSGTFSGYFPLARASAGKYAFFYKNDTGHDEENLAIEFGWEEGSTARYQGRAMQVSDAADLDTIKSTVDGIQTDLSNGTDGLGALKTLIDTVNTDLSNGTDGLGALKTLVDTVNTDLSNGTDGLGAIKTAVDAVNTDLSNGTDGLGALKTLIDTVDTVVDGIQTDLSNGTDGLGALKTLIDTVDTVADAILVDTGTTIPATLGSPAGASMSADVAANLAAINALNDPTAAANADAVWDEALSGHSTSGSASWTLGQILVDTGTTLPATLGSPAGASVSADVLALKGVADGIQTDLSNGTDGLGALKTLIDTVDTVADGIQTDLSNGTDGLGALKSLIDTADAAIDAVGVDVGNFSGGTNLQSALAVIGSGFDDRNVSMAVSSLVGDKHLFKVASNSFSGGAGTFVLTRFGTGYPAPSAADDTYIGGMFRVLAGGNVARDVAITDYTGSSGTVAYAGATLADDDVVVFMPQFSNIGMSNEAASASASDAGKSVFARLRYIAELVASQKAVQRSTFKKYLKRSTAGVLSNDPTDSAESASSTTTAAAYEALDVITISFDEGSDASIEDIFAVFKWKHQGTNGGSGGSITTRWYVSGLSSAPSAGDAISGVSDAVAVSSEFAGTTTAATSSVSGTLNSNALSAFSNGKIHLILAGKAGSAGDTCTGWIYHSSSVDVTYEV
jgi:bacterioferritin (cytochrome b1)